MAGACRARILRTITAAARVPGHRRGDADRVHQGDRRFRRAVDPGRRVPGAADADLLPDPRLLQPERRVRDRHGQRAPHAGRDAGARLDQSAPAISSPSAAPSRAAARHASRGARAFGNALLLARHLRRDPAAARHRAGVVRRPLARHDAAGVLHARSLSLRVVAAHESDREQPRPRPASPLRCASCSAPSPPMPARAIASARAGRSTSRSCCRSCCRASSSASPT